MADFTFEQLPPEAQAAFGPPKQEIGPVQEFVDPVDVETVEGLVDLATKSEGFSARAHANANLERYESDEAYRTKLEDLNAAIKQRGFKWEDVDLWKGTLALGHLGVGLYNYAKKQESAVAKFAGTEAVTPIGKGFQALSGKIAGPGTLVRPIEKFFGVKETPAEVNERLKVASKESAEIVSNVEQGVEGAFGMAETALKKGYRHLPFTATPKDWSREERAADLRSEMEQDKKEEQIAAGKGEMTEALVGSALKDLGIEADPAEIAKMVDPISFAAIPGGFKLVGFIGKGAVQLSTKVLSRTQAAQAAATLNAAKDAAALTARNARKYQGSPVLGQAARSAAAAEQGAQNLAAAEAAMAELPAGSQAVAKATDAFNQSRKFVGEKIVQSGQRLDRAVEAGTGAGIYVAGMGVSGLELLSKMPRVIGVRLPIPKGIGKGLRAAGKDLVKEGTGTFSPGAQTAASIVKGGVDIALGATKGVALADIPFMAMLSESPDETANFPLFGGAGGAGGGARVGAQRGVGAHYLTQKLTDASYKVANTPGSDAAMNYGTAEMAKTGTEGQVRRFAALRAAARSKGAEVYWLSPEKGNREVSPYRAAINRLFKTLEEQNLAEQTPGFNITTPEGKQIIVVTDPGTVGHEYSHAGQAFFGDEGMRLIRNEVLAEYGDQWNARGNLYVNRFTTEKSPQEYLEAGETWREKILDISKPGWREKGWSPEEVIETSDRYLNNELSAEVIDFVIRNQGPELQQNKGLPGKIARAMAAVLETFGVEPFPEGMKTVGQDVPLTYRGVERITDAWRQADKGATQDVVSRNIREPKTKATVPGVGAPATSDREKVIQWVNEKATPTDASRKEAVEAAVAAMDAGEPIRLDYFSTEGEPGGSTASMREERRIRIEQGRGADQADKALVTKDFWPVSVTLTKASGPQFQGWSVDNFTANLGKFGGWMKDLTQKGAQVPGELNVLFTEYGIDPTKGLTPKNWNAILADVNTFSKNQQAGRAGSGIELRFPPEGIPGYSKPVESGAAATPLNQTRADFINYLLGLPLAGKPGKAPVIRDATKVPLDVAGAQISAATLPGRVEVPVEPRKPYGEGGTATREKAEALGIESVSVQEVNPLRKVVEQVSKDSEVPAPDFIEVSQRLNFKEIGGFEGKPEGVPDVRANVLTTKAGFQAPKIADEIKRLGEARTRQDLDPNGLGVTGAAWQIGALAEGGRDIAALKAAQELHLGRVQELRAKGETQAAVIEATKGQMFREAWEAAQDVGSAKGALPKAPLAENKAHTEAGRKLESDGWKFSERHNVFSDGSALDGIAVTDATTGKEGAIGYRVQPDKSVYVDYVRSPQKGIGTVLYREMLSRLQAQGVKILTGSVVAPEPISIRRKLLGEPEVREKGEADFSKKSVEAVSAIGGEKWANVRNIIPGDVLFQVPPKGFKGEYVKDAAVIFDDKKVFSGPSHYDAIVKGQEYYDRRGIKFNDQPQPIDDGWSTNKRNLISRDEAYDVGIESGQISEAKVLAWMKENGLDTEGGTGDWLESSAFNAVKSFQAPPAKDRLQNEPSDATMRERKFQAAPEKDKKKLPHSAEGEDFDVLHYSSKAGLSKISPAFFSKGQASNIDRRGGDKSFFFVKGSDLGQDVNLFGEGGLNAYEAQISGTKLYDLRKGSEDPLNWEGTVNREKADDILKDAGYDGLITETQDGRTVVAMFTPVPVIQHEKLSKRSKFALQTPKERDLFGDETGREKKGESFVDQISPKALSAMTQAQKREYYPEAKVPKSVKDEIELDIQESPLYKEAKDEAEAVELFADRLVEFAKEHKSRPEFKAGAKWYDELEPLLKKTYGKDARLAAELLAATSPQTNPNANFAYAHDAYLSIKAGRFEKRINKFKEGMAKVADESWEPYYKREVSSGRLPNPPANPSPATFLAHWIVKHNLQPRSPHGAKYGINSDAVLKVAARTWMRENQGPKTENFVKNMVGESDEATIDIWAARTMRWAGYEGRQERWRVLPENDGGLSDADFAFSQKAFRVAAERLEMKPSQLQGALWFAEKYRWAKPGWSRLNLGSFTEEIKKNLPTVESRFRQRFEQEQQRAGAKKAKVGTQLEILPK